MSCFVISNAQIINIFMHSKRCIPKACAYKAVYAQFYNFIMQILKTTHYDCACKVAYAQNIYYFMHICEDKDC